MEPDAPDREWRFVIPSYKYAPGDGPTAVEYEATSLSGEVTIARADLGEAVEFVMPCKIRHRYLWGDRPGAWDDEGVTWKRPR